VHRIPLQAPHASRSETCTDQSQYNLYVYSPRTQIQRKEIEQIDRGQNLQSNRDIQLISTSMIKTKTGKNIENNLPNVETIHKVNSIHCESEKTGPLLFLL